MAHAPGNDAVIYAIGDVHGEASRLQQLHALIFERHDLMYRGQGLQIVHLGDYVDRGPDSAGVIKALMALEQRGDVACINLRGNHEAMMLSGLADATPGSRVNWLENGGDKTLASYHARGDDGVPDRHLKWLKTLPLIHVEAARKLVFVHAGIDPDRYPEEPEEVYMWTRTSRFFEVQNWDNPALEGWIVVHGHTPTEDSFPDDQAAAARRINIDTGAVFGGRLTAAIFAPGEDVRFMYA